MKAIFIRLWSTSALFCFGISQAVTHHYYVRNDSSDPIMIGLYNIDAQGHVLNPDNYAYILAPTTKTTEGQSAHLISIDQPSQVNQRFIYSKSINDMVKTVVQHLNHPLVTSVPILFNENNTPIRYYKIYYDIETYDEKVGGASLVFEPLERPIIASQSRLKFNLKKEDDVRRADSLLAKELAAQAAQKVRLRLKEQKEQQQKKKAEQLLKKQALEKQYQVRPAVVPSVLETMPETTSTTKETFEPSYQHGAHFKVEEEQPYGEHYHVPEEQEAPVVRYHIPTAATALQAEQAQRIERYRRFSNIKRRESVGIRPQKEAVEGEVVKVHIPQQADVPAIDLNDPNVNVFDFMK